MQRLNNHSTVEYFLYFVACEDVHVNVLGGFLVLLANFLNIASKEGVR